MNWCIWIWLGVGRAACMWEALIVVRRRRLGTLDLEDRESVIVVLLLGIYREDVVWPLGVSIAKGGRWTWSIIGWNDRLEHVLQRHSCKVAVARLGVCIIEKWQLIVWTLECHQTIGEEQAGKFLLLTLICCTNGIAVDRYRRYCGQWILGGELNLKLDGLVVVHLIYDLLGASREFDFPVVVLKI